MSEAVLRFQGEAARLQMLERTKNHPQAQGLVNTIAGFFGDYLFLEENSTLLTSRYQLDFDFKPIKFKNASIELATNSNRVAEALIHEALHLLKPIEGWPTGVRLYAPDEQKEYIDDLAKYSLLVVNLIGHEINLGKFIDLGFKTEYFLAKEESSPNYKIEARRHNRHSDYIHELNFAWWCYEYFKNYISITHGRGEIARRNAKQALKYGSTVHPQLAKVVEKSKRWLEVGLFKDQSSYAQQANELLTIMGMPWFDMWATLKRQEDGSIKAIVQTY